MLLITQSTRSPPPRTATATPLSPRHHHHHHHHCIIITIASSSRHRHHHHDIITTITTTSPARGAFGGASKPQGCVRFDCNGTEGAFGSESAPTRVRWVGWLSPHKGAFGWTDLHKGVFGLSEMHKGCVWLNRFKVMRSRDCKMVVKEIVSRLLEEEEKLEWWFEQDIDKEEERFEGDEDGGEV
ncbi:hypothetical protein Tco_0758565 [Tanacetum coccineum]